MSEKRYTGRPSKNKDFKLYDGDLYKLLLDKLPTEYVKFGRVDTKRIADVTGFARFTVYGWLNGTRFSRKAVKALLELSTETDEAEKKGALTKEDLLPFFIDF